MNEIGAKAHIGFKSRLRHKFFGCQGASEMSLFFAWWQLGEFDDFLMANRSRSNHTQKTFTLAANSERETIVVDENGWQWKMQRFDLFTTDEMYR
jgi:hypothetical protein